MKNVHFHVGDGSRGWPDEGPFDAIVVAAASPRVPESLTSQLAEGGRLVIPVGAAHSQTLTLVRRTKKGLSTTDVCPCIFVKLIGREGYEA